MKSRVSLVALGVFVAAGMGGTLTAQQTPQSAGADYQEPAGDGPRGSSHVAAGEARYDAVGYAGIGEQGGVSIASPALAPGSFAEVTALDSGRTIVVAVTPGPVEDRIATLSRTAATQLGITSDLAPVRVRRVTPTPQDAALLKAGQAASGRSDAPAALLTPLRKRLGPPPRPTPAPLPVKAPAPVTPAPIKPAPIKPAPVVRPPQTVAKPAPVAPARPAPATTAAKPAYYVQVAALSNEARAKSLAASMGGTVTPAGKLFRVQLGPFADSASAERGRATAVRKGYTDARIVRSH
jgi:rare lipoprotein A